MKHKKQKFLTALAAMAAALCLAACAKEPAQTLPETSAETQPLTTPAPTTMPEIPFSLALDPGEPIVVWEESLLLTGTADPRELLTAGGQPVEVGQDGSFSCRVSLELGSQTVQLRYKGESHSYQVERRYAFQSASPMGGEYHPSQTVLFRVQARAGSQVKVTFRGKEIAMAQATDQLGRGNMEGFLMYEGQAVISDKPAETISLGTITYTVTCDGITETWESGELTCAPYAPNVSSDPSVTPEGYWDVGSGYIVEVINGGSETFSGRDSNDRSDPTNNYLPEGTVDYGGEHVIHNKEEDRNYRALRCGIRVYTDSKNTPIHGWVRSVDCYYGTLPDHNEIAIAGLTVEGRHTYLTLDCLWKAPFFFDYEEQDFEDVDKRKFYVERFDARYVDIRFCYADRIEGDLEIPADHPLFASAEIIPNTSDYTLRLWLKQEGGFYGWDAYYNEDDQLVFQFLNPAQVTQADNQYGADLTGVVIMLDVGHGGRDVGAVGTDENGIQRMEEERNLILAQQIQAELEKIGATVVLNRTDNDMQLTQRERIALLKEVAPDYCLAIHHNSNTNKSYRGYEAGFFTPWSQQASQYTVQTVSDAALYPDAYIRWHVFYVGRTTTCPVVLTENGYMSNYKDLNQILSLEANQQKAAALTQAVVNYFLEINGLPVSKG